MGEIESQEVREKNVQINIQNMNLSSTIQESQCDFENRKILIEKLQAVIKKKDEQITKLTGDINILTQYLQEKEKMINLYEKDREVLHETIKKLEVDKNNTNKLL
jgi:chromosome segregation ATPase